MTVLYEGHQIYFGRTDEAQKFFEDMGFLCPPRQTTADFLTSLTSPSERRVRPGYEDKVPRTPTEFAQRWRDSPDCSRLLQEIEAFDQQYPIGGESFQKFGEARRLMQSKQQLVIPTQAIGLGAHSDILAGERDLPIHFRFTSRLFCAWLAASNVFAETPA